jgi:fatty acid desaturase
LLALNEQYKLLFRNAMKSISESRFRVRVIRDFVTTGVVALVYFYLLPKSGLHFTYTVLPMILILPLVFSYRAISDHYGMPAVKRSIGGKSGVTPEEMDQWHKENRQMQDEVTGWVVLTSPFIEWVWSNVNYHEVHHKFPYLSYKYLPKAFNATSKILPYAVRKGYTASLIALRKSSYYSRPEEIEPYLSIPR